MKKVLCVWEDAGQLESGSWVFRKDLEPSAPHIFNQVGYLFEITPEAVVLTEAFNDEQIAPRTRIPIGMVRRLVELVEGKAVKLPRKVRK